MYKPRRNNSKNLEEFMEYIEQELRHLSGELLVGNSDSIQHKIWYSLPPKPAEGLSAYLDNSIGGIATTGLHEYRGGTWVKL